MPVADATLVSLPMDWVTWTATLGQAAPREWPAVIGGYVIAVGLALAVTRLRVIWQLAACVILIAAAIPVSHHAETVLGGTDDHRIIIDEIATFPVATIGLPLARHPLLLVGVLVASWAMDDLKPPPAGWAEAIPGGAGIVLDDAAANLYALAFGHLLWWWIRRRSRRRKAS